MSSVRLAIIASEKSWYFRQLEAAAVKLNVDVVRPEFGNLAIRVGGANRYSSDEKSIVSEDAASKSADSWEPDFDAAIVRTMPLGSLEQVIFRMDVLRCWESTGTPVVNSPICLETSIDKLLTLSAFTDNNVPFPETYACQNAEQALNAFEMLNHDVVLKPIFGGEGRGIIRVCEHEVAYRIFKSLEYSRSVIYCQKFIANIEKEIRILFIGDKHFAVERMSEKSWIRNASLGGTGKTYQPNQTEIEMARRAANSVNGRIVGVDLLLDRNGEYFVLEVNAVPGWKLLEKVTGVDISSEIIQTVIETVRR